MTTVFFRMLSNTKPRNEPGFCIGIVCSLLACHQLAILGETNIL